MAGKSQKVEACSANFEKIARTNITEQREGVLQMYKEALPILYQKRDDDTNTYELRTDKSKTITASEYDSMTAKTSVAIKDIEKLCSTAKKTSGKKKAVGEKKEKDVTVTNVNTINKLARQGIKDANKTDDVKTSDFVKSAYEPSPWKQEKGADGKFKRINNSGDECKNQIQCNLDDHICFQSKCVLAERRVFLTSHNVNDKKELLAIVTDWTPKEATFMTKDGSKTVPRSDIKNMIPYRECPPYIHETITITHNGKEVTINQLAAKRTKQRFQRMANGNYTVRGDGESHGRWMPEELLKLYNENMEGTNFKARNAKNEEEWKKLITDKQYVILLYDVANKNIPYVLQTLKEGGVERVYQNGIDLKTINQLYTKDSLKKALEKAGFDINAFDNINIKVEKK